MTDQTKAIEALKADTAEWGYALGMSMDQRERLGLIIDRAVSISRASQGSGVGMGDEVERVARALCRRKIDLNCRGESRAKEWLDRAEDFGWSAHVDDALAVIAALPPPETFQARVAPWMLACFGAEISSDMVERGDRLLEEVLELLQSGGYDPARVAPLRDYVYGRPVGEPMQEAGGVEVTMAAYCLAAGIDKHAAGETELARIWTKVEKIREKQAAKPKHSPLPVALSPPATPQAPEDVRQAIHAFQEQRDLLLSMLWLKYNNALDGSENRKFYKEEIKTLEKGFEALDRANLLTTPVTVTIEECGDIFDELDALLGTRLTKAECVAGAVRAVLGDRIQIAGSEGPK